MSAAHSIVYALVLAAAPTSAQSVWSVDDDGGPGVDFLDILSAIDVAGDGDLILVHEGEYDGFAIGGKSLEIHGIGSVMVEPSGVAVQDLGVQQSVVVRGLDFTYEFRVHDNAGAVWLEECTFDSGTVFSLFGSAALVVEDSASVVLRGVTARGAQSQAPLFHSIPPHVHHGLRAVDSSIAAYDSSFLGGDGDDPFCGDPHTCNLSQVPPGLGAFVQGGTFHAYGCTAIGGDGVWGDGAAGLYVTASAVARLRDTEAVGGAAGPSGPVDPPEDGPPVVGDYEDWPGAARSLSVTSLVGVGDPVEFELQGEVGDLAALLIGFQPSSSAFLDWIGAELFLGGTVVLFAGTIDGSGELVFAPDAPGIGGAGFFPLYSQALFVAGFDEFLSGPSSTVILPSAP